MWFDEKGKPIWPPKELYPDGALTEPVKRVLEPGVLLDRYGTPKGNFVAPKGTPYEMRSLPPGAEKGEYHIYEVVKPVETWESVVAPWFGEVGLGTQYKFEKTIEQLVKEGYLREVKRP